MSMPGVAMMPQHLWLHAMLETYLGTVRVILDHSVEKEISTNYHQEPTGLNALMWACHQGHQDIVKLLLEHPNRKHVSLFTTTYSNSNWNSDDFRQFGDTTIMTAIMLAVRQGHKNIVALILEFQSVAENNLHLYCKSSDGMTALMLACDLGHTDIVKLFLTYWEKERDWNHWNNQRGSKFKMNFNVRDTRNKMTALMHASKNGHKEIVQLFLDYSKKYWEFRRSLNIIVKDNAGHCAGTLAYLNGHKDIVKLMLKFPRDIKNVSDPIKVLA